MTSRLQSLIGDAAKVSAAAWGAIFAEPWVSRKFPEIGEPLQYLVAAIFAAVALELLLQLVLGWPRFRVIWTDQDDDGATAELVARFRKSTQASQPFGLRVVTPGSGWIGYQALRGLMRLGAVLEIRIERAAIAPVCELSTKVEGIPTVTALDQYQGFRVDLGSAPRRPGPWHSAVVRWSDTGVAIGDEFNIDYVLVHRNAILCFFLNLLVWKSSSAKNFRVQGN